MGLCRSPTRWLMTRSSNAPPHLQTPQSAEVPTLPTIGSRVLARWWRVDSNAPHQVWVVRSPTHYPPWRVRHLGLTSTPRSNWLKPLRSANRQRWRTPQGSSPTKMCAVWVMPLVTLPRRLVNLAPTSWGYSQVQVLAQLLVSALPPEVLRNLPPRKPLRLLPSVV